MGLAVLRGKLQLSLCQVMELVLVKLRHLIWPCVDCLSAFQPQGLRELGSTSEVLNGFRLLHTPNGKRYSHAMSSPLTAVCIRVMHNPRMSKKTTGELGREPDLTTLASRLRFAMDQRGTNPNAIESSTGITRQTLYAVLNGATKNFTFDVLERVAAHLGVRHEWLAKGEMPIHPAPELKDDDEIQLVYDFRDMSPSHQRDLADIARRWAEEDGSPQSPTRPFHHPKLPRQ